MELEMRSTNDELHVKVSGKIPKEILETLSLLLDHASFNKKDVLYNEKERIIKIKFQRNEYEKVKRKKFLWFYVWSRGNYPQRRCNLVIRNIERCHIRDEHPEEVDEEIVSGISFKGNEIYIGSMFEHEYPYGIELIVSEIDISLTDL